MTAYEDFCKKCIQGKIGFKPDFYIIEGIHKNHADIPKDNLDVTIVSPTEAAVDQAKSELKHENGINRIEKMSDIQKGGKGDSKQIKRNKQKTRKKQYKIQGSVRNKKGAGGKKREKKKVKKTYKSLWM